MTTGTEVIQAVMRSLTGTATVLVLVDPENDNAWQTSYRCDEGGSAHSKACRLNENRQPADEHYVVVSAEGVCPCCVAV